METEISSNIKPFRLKQIVVEAFMFVAVPVPTLGIELIPEKLIPNFEETCKKCGLHMYTHGSLTQESGVSVICPKDWIVLIHGSMFVFPDNLWKMVATQINKPDKQR